MKTNGESDTELFIADVHNRPAIWNRSMGVSKQTVQQEWIQLASVMGCRVEQVKKRWRALRDRLRIEMRRIPRNSNGTFSSPVEEFESRWEHFRSMTFLGNQKLLLNIFDNHISICKMVITCKPMSVIDK